MFKRILKPSLTRSFFLFGPRSTGKSTLLRKILPASKALWIDLLDTTMERNLSRSPAQILAILEIESDSRKPRDWVVIDEIQKVPDLLSEVQSLIQKNKFKFAMTGSSARKLRRGGANLLGGRASWYELYSLTHFEIGNTFNLDSVLSWGSLPELLTLPAEERSRFLNAYCNLYLKEEVVSEQLVRKIQPFRDFLELVALQNAQIINYTKFANDVGVDVTTVQTYFEILKDTLIGFELQPFHLSIRKRQRKNPKFYFFDNGVTRSLAGLIESQLVPRTQTYGIAFEQFLVAEIFRLMKALEKDWRLSYLTTKDGAEVDLIIDRHKSRFSVAIEIKSSNTVDPIEVRSFERLASEIPNAKLYYLSQDPVAQKIGRVYCLSWKEGLREIFL